MLGLQSRINLSRRDLSSPDESIISRSYAPRDKRVVCITQEAIAKRFPETTLRPFRPTKRVSGNLGSREL